MYSVNALIKNIIEKTAELALILREHPAAKEYAATSETMSKDRQSQKLLEKLVFLGRDINEKISLEIEVSIEKNAEYELMKREFESNEIVKRHILSQKEYLILLNRIIALIKDPISGKN